MYTKNTKLILILLTGENGEGNGTPFQYSCLENPMDGGAWKAAVHGVAEGRAWLSDFTFTFHFSCTGEGNGNPLQCSCLENPRERGAWWAATYGVAQSRTRLKWLSSSTPIEGFPGGASSKETACQCRRQKRCRFDPWVTKIPWRRKWQPTPVCA